MLLTPMRKEIKLVITKVVKKVLCWLCCFFTTLKIDKTQKRVGKEFIKQLGGF